MKLRLLRLFAFALMLGALLLTACAALSGKPTVVISSPPSASQFQEGQAVAVQSSSTDGQGIAKVELVVDGVVVHTDFPPQPQPQFTLVQTWTATPGTHTILVRATNTANVTSDPIAVFVSVTPSVALAGTPSATASPQSTATISSTTTSTLTTTATAFSAPTITPNAPPPPAPNNPPPAPNNPPPAPNTSQPRVGSSGWSQLEPLKAGSISGVLLAGKFRTSQQLNGMSADDQRNILITELANRTSDSVQFFQGLDDKTLAGAGAVLVFIRAAKIRKDQDIKAVHVDDLRNILIVEIKGASTNTTGYLQGLSNLDLVSKARDYL